MPKSNDLCMICMQAPCECGGAARVARPTKKKVKVKTPPKAKPVTTEARSRAVSVGYVDKTDLRRREKEKLDKATKLLWFMGMISSREASRYINTDIKKDTS